MIISENKPINEILGFLKNVEKVVLIGCNQCAAICKSGGEEEVLKMKEALEIEGKTVLGYRILDPACNLLKSNKDLKELKSELDKYKGLKKEDFKGDDDAYIEYKLDQRLKAEQVKQLEMDNQAVQKEYEDLEIQSRMENSFSTPEEKDEYILYEAPAFSP